MMLDKFQDHINEQLPFLKDAKLLLAISGGIDSVVLAHLLSMLKLNFSLAHCNFKLRFDDSDKDEEFVKHLGVSLGVPCHHISFETEQYANEHKLSTQMAARELRYHWFNDLMKDNAYQYVLTAHHANDNLETVLINLTRGATLQKLTGIPEINGNIIRPLLPFTRKEIEQFTIDNQISWREDESNQSTKYFRNKIRHQVIPVLENLNGSVLQTFNSHLTMLKREKRVLEHHLQTAMNLICVEKNKVIELNIQKLLELSDSKVYLHYYLEKYGFTEWDNVMSLLTAQSGKFVMSHSHRLLKDRDVLILEKNSLHLKNFEFKIAENCEEIKKPIPLQFELVTTVFTTDHAIFVDAAQLKYPLCLRKKKTGDVFFPFGMKGKKKVSKYFKDEKLSLSQKEQTWLLCDATDAIVWIVDKRADSRFSVTNKTKNIIKITSPQTQPK